MLTKADVMLKLSEKTELTKKNAETVYVALTEIIRDELANGNDFQINGFGTFKVSERAARKGRNPKTGAEIQIAASKVVSFKPSSKLKEAVNK